MFVRLEEATQKIVKNPKKDGRNLQKKTPPILIANMRVGYAPTWTLKASSVLTINWAMVMGPTPPGTGVMA